MNTFKSINFLDNCFKKLLVFVLFTAGFIIDLNAQTIEPSLKFKVNHRGAIKATVQGNEHIQICQTIKSARRWLQPRWPATEGHQLASSTENVLKAVKRRLAILNNASQTKPKSSFQKLSLFLSEKECLRKNSLVQPRILPAGLKMDRYLIDEVFCQDDGRGGFEHVYSFSCVKPQ